MCDCSNAQPPILLVQGNALALTVTLLLREGSKDIVPLAACTDVEAFLVDTFGGCTALDIALEGDEGNSLCLYIPDTLPLGVYGVEVKGRHEGNSWRYCQEGVLRCVYSGMGETLFGGGTANLGTMVVGLLTTEPTASSRLEQIEERVSALEDELTIK